jgi:hypothetical protein
VFDLVSDENVLGDDFEGGSQAPDHHSRRITGGWLGAHAHAHGWSMLSTLADKVIDLDRGTVR